MRTINEIVAVALTLSVEELLVELHRANLPAISAKLTKWAAAVEEDIASLTLKGRNQHRRTGALPVWYKSAMANHHGERNAVGQVLDCIALIKEQQIGNSVVKAEGAMRTEVLVHKDAVSYRQELIDAGILTVA